MEKTFPKKNHEHFKTSKTCISLRIYQWLDYQSYVDVCANINDPWLDYQSHFDVCISGSTSFILKKNNNNWVTLIKVYIFLLFFGICFVQ
jgi:hypothetical protein